MEAGAEVIAEVWGAGEFGAGGDGIRNKQGKCGGAEGGRRDVLEIKGEKKHGGGAAGKFIGANNFCVICEFIVRGGFREGWGGCMDVCG